MSEHVYEQEGVNPDADKWSSLSSEPWIDPNNRPDWSRNNDNRDFGPNISEPEMNSQSSANEYGDKVDYGRDNISEPEMNSQSSAGEFGDKVDYGRDNISEPWMTNQSREFNQETGKFHVGGDLPNAPEAGDFRPLLGESGDEFASRMESSFGSDWKNYAKEAFSDSSQPVPKTLESILGWTNVKQPEEPAQ